MKTVGITGQLCSGLENFNDLCEAYGYPIFEADLAIKFLLNWREDIMTAVRIQFGYDSANKGFIDGTKFSTTEKFNRLLDVIDVDLMLMWEKFTLKHRRAELVFFKSNILYERKWHKDLDASIFVFMTPEHRLEKIKKLLSVSYNEAKEISEKEMPSKDKISQTDYVIHNYDNLSFLSQFESIKSQILYGKHDYQFNDF